MNYISIALISVVIVLIYLIYLNKFQKNPKTSNPESQNTELTVPHGPMSLPMIGNLLQLGDRPFETLFKWSDLYGPIFQIKLGSEKVVILNGTDTIREALIDYGNEFAGRPKLYMIHATLKGKGLISSPYNEDYAEHKRFLLSKFNRFGKRRSSLEINCLQTIRETFEDYRQHMDNNLEYTNSNLKNSLSQIASQNILTMTFGDRILDRRLFSKLMDLIAENFKNAAVSSVFNFLPVSRVFKTYILKNVFKCSEFLNDLIPEKMNEFNEFTDFGADFGSLETSETNADDESRAIGSNIIEAYLKELINNESFLTCDEQDDKMMQQENTAEFCSNARKITARRRSSISSLNSTVCVFNVID
jgi:hypothetical protein